MRYCISGFCCFISCVGSGLSWILKYLSFCWYSYLFFFSIFDNGGYFFRDEDCVCFISDILLNACTRNMNSMSSTFSIVSLGFIGLYKMVVVLRFISDDICDSCGKGGCHMKIFLTLCAWLYVYGVNIGCRKIARVFWGDCWNVFGVLDSCWLLMRVFICFSWRTLGEVGFWCPLRWCAGANYPRRLTLIFWG